MARKPSSSSSQKTRSLNLPFCFRSDGKQIKNGNLPSCHAVQTVRDLFVYSEKYYEAKSCKMMKQRINGECLRKELNSGRDLKASQGFLKSLRAETSNEVNYRLIPSPEFKPGGYFMLPDNRTSIFDYNPSYMKRHVYCCNGVESRETTCKQNVITRSRRQFCEVMGSEMCLDCKGAKLREKFNNKINYFYPFLEYDKDKRPYGYCPRALRLTEPLPMRIDKYHYRLQLPRADLEPTMSTRRIKSGREMTSNDATIRVFIRHRPNTC